MPLKLTLKWLKQGPTSSLRVYGLLVATGGHLWQDVASSHIPRWGEGGAPDRRLRSACHPVWSRALGQTGEKFSRRDERTLRPSSSPNLAATQSRVGLRSNFDPPVPSHHQHLRSPARPGRSGLVGSQVFRPAKLAQASTHYRIEILGFVYMYITLASRLYTSTHQTRSAAHCGRVQPYALT